jgi:hypothetical protein
MLLVAKRDEGFVGVFRHSMAHFALKRNINKICLPDIRIQLACTRHNSVKNLSVRKITYACLPFCTHSVVLVPVFSTVQLSMSSLLHARFQREGLCVDVPCVCVCMYVYSRA